MMQAVSDRPDTSDPVDRTVSGTVNRAISPSGIAPPAANYAHAVLSTAPRRWLHTSGVVPISPDGTVPSALVDQAETVWANIGAMLDDAAMGPTDVVSVTTYVTPGHDLREIMAVRDRFLAGHRASSTLVVVAELAQPAWLMEIQVVAAA